MRQWRGSTVCPLLFDGQYADGESGWAYNRFRYYSPDLGVYGAQDPLGLSPNLGWAQGYVVHPGCMVDLMGLMGGKAHKGPQVHHATDPARWANGHFRPGNGGSGVIGDDAVQAAKPFLERQGYTIVGEQVRMTGGGKTTVTDLLAMDSKRNYVPVEVKSGTARESLPQSVVYGHLDKGGTATLSGKVATDLGVNGEEVMGRGIGLRFDGNVFEQFRLGQS